VLGVQLSTNLDELQAWDPTDDGLVAFGVGGTERSAGTAYYDFTFIKDKTAVAFDIMSWDPQSTGTTMQIDFKDGDSKVVNLAQVGALETDVVFVGLTSDVPFTSIRLFEPLELNDLGRPDGNEEVSLDKIYTADAVPEPASVMLLGLGGLALIRRR
jgi:hypothetical protein